MQFSSRVALPPLSGVSTMTDRELLEAAARAAGLHTRSDRTSVWIVEDDGSPVHRWNPLTDDGDALRLAVKLRLSIYFSNRLYKVAPGIEAMMGDVCCEGGIEEVRYSIVSAAAAIGNKLEKSEL